VIIVATFQEGNIECPFYLNQEQFCIICEGYIKEARSNKLTFKNMENKKKYIEKYCTVDGGRQCRHHKIMATLYDRGVLR
jgi:hypothetical protein